MRNASIKYILKAEAAAVFLASILIYSKLDFSWWTFGLLLFAFDISMVGYMVNPKIGALLYNAVHTYTAPSLLVGVWFFVQEVTMLCVALIWFAHISMDRAIGYSLKLDGFKNTHLT